MTDAELDKAIEEGLKELREQTKRFEVQPRMEGVRLSARKPITVHCSDGSFEI